MDSQYALLVCRAPQKLSMKTTLTRHLSSDEPRVLVVDGSRVVRRLIEQILQTNLPGVTVPAC